MSWLLYNLFCFAVIASLAHRKIFEKMRHRHFIGDIGTPLLGAFLVIGILYLLLPLPAGNIGKCIVLGICVLAGEATSLMTIKDVRDRISKT